MSGLRSKERVNALQQAAKRLLEDHQIDIWTTLDYRLFGRLLAEQEHCHIETGKRHVLKAVRRMRGEYVAQRGGARIGAGRPRKISD